MAYRVRFVDYPEHYRRIWDEVTGAVEECLSRGDLILREQTDRFESALAGFVGVRHAVGLNSGTDALFFSLRAAGVLPGDEVITVSHTFVATLAAVHYCGATPVLVDVGEDMNMDAGQLERSISSRTKAIIPVHLNGRMCDMKAVMAVADEHNVTVIEDAAQSLGAKFAGKNAGSLGLTGCFSFYPAKILGCAGDGGALLTDDDAVAEKARLLRDHGYRRSTGDILFYGYNSRIDNIQSAILGVKLKYLPGWIERRREIAAMYHDGLGDLDTITLPPAPDPSGEYYDVFQNYVIRAQQRDRLFEFLKEKGIETLISWPTPTHHHPALQLSRYHLPVTEKISKEVLSLPLYPEISDEHIDSVIETIRTFSW